MGLPSYYLKCPEVELPDSTQNSFDRLFDEFASEDSNSAVRYSLDAPKWQFLNYLADKKEIVLHGSGDPNITEFEPRKSNDALEFGNQSAVYAASDGIWAAYYAILDRDHYVRSLVNSCIHISLPDGEHDSYYYFSINEDALPHDPWRDGTIYILPRRTFEGQPVKEGRASTHWRSFEPVKPLAKLSVSPEDFPFLNQIRGHDVDKVKKLAEKDTDGFPWVSE